MNPQRGIPRSAPLLLGVALVLGGCGPDRPALRVDGATFSEERLLGLRPAQVWQLAELTALGLAFTRDEAADAGAPLLDRRIEERLLERFRAELALRRAGVEDDVLRAHYLTDPRHELVVRHVVALAQEGASAARADSARRKARRALERIRGGEPFARVAGDLSEEPGAAERGGLLQPGRRGSWVPEFWRAASSLDEGEVSGVVRTEYGFHVLRLEERRVVPFREVRGAVAVDAARMMGGARDAWEAWRDSVAPGIRLDTAAVEAAARGALADTAPVARWEGGRYTARRLRRHLTSLPAERWREASTGAGPAAVDEARADALRARAAAEARAMGLSVPEPQRDAIRSEWRDQVARWAAALGFRPGQGPAAVAGTAREAVASTGQNARIARREAAERAPLFRAAYEIGGTAVPETGRSGAP